MGYTHYWNKPQRVLNRNAFETFGSVAHSIIEKFNKLSDIGGVYTIDENGDKKRIILKGSEGKHRPLITGEMIGFNGDADEGLDHEDFFITNEKKYLEDTSFGFCKTNRKPYDLAVCAVLIAFKKRFVTSVKISSDGKPDSTEWTAALDLYNMSCPENEKIRASTLEKWLKE